jgi:sialic acid synthase
MSAAAGASACKLQKRENDTLYSSAMLDAPYEHEHSYGKTYGEHRRALEFGAKEYLACRTMAGVCRVDFFATAFDEPSVDFLMIVDVPAIKLASGSLTDFALLKHAASYGKPIILSTGGGTYAQVDAAVETLLGGEVTLCAAALHGRLSGAELRRVEPARHRGNAGAVSRDTIIGWSGHDPGISMALGRLRVRGAHHRKARHVESGEQRDGPRVQSRAERAPDAL